MLTIEEVKEHLPRVELRYFDRIYSAVIRGRQDKFATVFWNDRSWQFSWETITRAINADRPLVVI